MKTMNQRICVNCGHKVEEHDENGCHHNDVILIAIATAAIAIATVIAIATGIAIATAAIDIAFSIAVAAIAFAAFSITAFSIAVAVEYIGCDCNECVEHKHVFACKICGKEMKE